MAKAKFTGGPWDGKELELDNPPLSMDVDGVRYVLGLTDKHGVLHYHVPPVIDSKPSGRRSR